MDSNLHLLMTVLIEEYVFTASDKTREIACDTYPLHREGVKNELSKNPKVQVQGLEWGRECVHLARKAKNTLLQTDYMVQGACI